MGPALLQVLPLALAAALSSVPITATLFILLSDSRDRSGLAFLVGTVLGTFAAVTVAAVAGQALPGRPRQHDDLTATLEVVVGVALVVLGVFNLVRRSRVEHSRSPGWLGSIGSFGPVPVFGIALALNVRPKAVLLVAAAGLALSRAGLDLEEELLLAVVYTAVATMTVVVPIVATILFPQRMEPRLVALKGWIAAHSTVISATIMILAGGFVIALGLSD